jgi:hypothetical protein
MYTLASHFESADAPDGKFENVNTIAFYFESADAPDQDFQIWSVGASQSTVVFAPHQRSRGGSSEPKK